MVWDYCTVGDVVAWGDPHWSKEAYMSWKHPPQMVAPVHTQSYRAMPVSNSMEDI